MKMNKEDPTWLNWMSCSGDIKRFMRRYGMTVTGENGELFWKTEYLVKDIALTPEKEIVATLQQPRHKDAFIMYIPYKSATIEYKSIKTPQLSLHRSAFNGGLSRMTDFDTITGNLKTDYVGGTSIVKAIFKLPEGYTIFSLEKRLK